MDGVDEVGISCGAMPFRIMIVEDSPTQAIQLQFLLEEQGWITECFDTAEAALDQLS